MPTRTQYRTASHEIHEGVRLAGNAVALDSPRGSKMVAWMHPRRIAICLEERALTNPKAEKRWRTGRSRLFKPDGARDYGDCVNAQIDVFANQWVTTALASSSAFAICNRVSPLDRGQAHCPSPPQCFSASAFKADAPDGRSGEAHVEVHFAPSEQLEQRHVVESIAQP